MKYRELLEKLQALTPEQLEQDVRVTGEDHSARIGELWILEEDYINPEGEGAFPVSEANLLDDFSEEALAKEPRVAHKGDVFLSEDF